LLIVFGLYFIIHNLQVDSKQVIPTTKNAEAKVLDDTIGNLAFIQNNSLIAFSNPNIPHKTTSLGTILAKADIVTAINQYDWNINTAYNVMICESGGNPTKINWNDHHRECDGSFGLMQIGCVNYKGNPQDLLDAELNLKIAYSVFKKQGWNAWKNCL